VKVILGVLSLTDNFYAVAYVCNLHNFSYFSIMGQNQSLKFAFIINVTNRIYVVSKVVPMLPLNTTPWRRTRAVAV